jgi:hypothetical protein
LFISATAQGRDAAYEWNGVERVVAVGDVHGAYESFAAVLESAGLIDWRLQWIGGRAHLVQTGDVVDRGPDSRKVMDLLMELEEQAEKAGGRVHALIGNHEAMNVAGFLDYVSPREFHSYSDPRSAERRAQAFRLHYKRLVKEASATKTNPPLSEDEARREFESRTPLGYAEHRTAFSPRGRYGRWILSHNVAVRIDGVVFSHGDWSEAMSAMGIREVNRRVRTELSGEAPLSEGVAFHPESPLQYRGISKLPLRGASQSFQRIFDRILSNLGARLMVVGHTVTRGVIEPRFAGRHISIDTGMLELYDGGHRAALEIEDGRLRALHPEGEVELPGDLDERTLPLYLAAIAEVDPENRSVHERIAADTP